MRGHFSSRDTFRPFPPSGVFIRARAPRCGLTAGGVTQAAARRAGLGTIYAHRLRRTAATAREVSPLLMAISGGHKRPLNTR